MKKEEKSAELRALEIEAVLVPLMFIGIFIGCYLVIITILTMGRVWDFLF